MAVTAATINVVGGFMITDRMLKMFKRQDRKYHPCTRQEYLIQAAYLAASVLFILGIRGLTGPDAARRGMQYAAIGMLVAIVGTLLNHEIVTYIWIIIGLVVGSLVGAAISIWMPMTAIPQRTAI